MIILSKNILDNKIKVASAAVLVLVPLYTWKTLYTTYKYLQKKYAEELLFHQRHNCVILYSGLNGMRGWPPYTKCVKFDINNKDSVQRLYEPIVYFIETATCMLDVACMSIGVWEVKTALIQASKRGVKIRLLMNLDNYNNHSDWVLEMKDAGVDIIFYVNQKMEMSSIMHYKYMVKDYYEDSGYTLTGSLNISKSAFTSNYEDIVITSNKYVVEAFKKDFENCWYTIKSENENVINRVALMDANWYFT